MVKFDDPNHPDKRLAQDRIERNNDIRSYNAMLIAIVVILILAMISAYMYSNMNVRNVNQRAAVMPVRNTATPVNNPNASNSNNVNNTTNQTTLNTIPVQSTP